MNALPPRPLSWKGSLIVAFIMLPVPVPLAPASPVLTDAALAVGSRVAGSPSGALASEAPPLDVSSTEDEATKSVEQGQTPLDEAYGLDSGRSGASQRSGLLRDTRFRFALRTMYFDRDREDGSESESWAIGGWAGLKTGYFFDHVSLGMTGYTSQHLQGDDDKDGALLLAPGQEGYSVLGELYADLRLLENVNLFVGRKEYDTPFINRNDVRMTPNTFEGIALMGSLPREVETDFRYGLGYLSRIKERNADEFIPMSEAAGASADRGVYTAGGLYQNGDFSIGAIDYYSPDIINIGYAQTKLTWVISDVWKPAFAAQFIDQRSVGSNLLEGDDFSGRQFGFKMDLPLGSALFSGAVTHTTDGTDMRSPWSGYPGYTSVQIEDFNRAGESAVLLRAGTRLPWIDGLSMYALWVHGTDPEAPDDYANDEYDLNLEWAPTNGPLLGFGIRLRYAWLDQRGGETEPVQDFRIISNYTLEF